MVGVDRQEGSEWTRVAVFDAEDLCWLLPALREGWVRSIELTRMRERLPAAQGSI